MDKIKIQIIKAREPLPELETPNWLMEAAKESETTNLEPRHNGSLYEQILKVISIDQKAKRNIILNRLKEHFSKQEFLQEFKKQTLTEEDGIIAPDNIFTQEEERSCSVANAATIMNCIEENSEINEHQLSSALIHAGKAAQSEIAIGQRDYDYHDFLKMIKTSSFADHFPGTELSCREFLGCDFNDLAELMYEMDGNDHDNGMGYIVVCSIESNIIKNTIHEIILVKVQDGQVTYHDPEVVIRGGGTFKTMPIAEFTKRWTVGFFGGYVVGGREIKEEN